MSQTESISILIPTFNEAENISDVLGRCITVLDNLNTKYEILVIDDASWDNTAEIAQKALGQKGRVIRRMAKKRSLSLSVFDGIKQAEGDVIIVMDGDGSHPPELIPPFMQELHQGYDLIVASRYVKGGGTENFPLMRKTISQIACFLGRLVTNIKDNASGFFCVRRRALENIELAPCGFKIGLEIFVKANFENFKEIPYIFVNRKKGKSKFSLMPVIQYLYQIFTLLIYKSLQDGTYQNI